MLKKSLLLMAVVGSALPAISFAEDPAPAAAPADPLSFNIGLVSDYRYRGISQSRLKPALQGGIDYASPSGFYVGAWASTIKWIKDAGGDAGVEVDLYGGYKGEIVKDLTYDVGVLTYQYPSNNLGVSPNTVELYGAITYGPATLKYSHSVSNLFGFDDSKGSGYLDLSATFDADGISLSPHVGYQKVKNYTTASYTDYSFTVSKDFSGFLLSAALVGTQTKDVPGSYAYVSPDGKNLGKATVVLGVKKTF
ncbi:MAG: TorF family putative porin [Rhizobacter sp.]